MFAHVGGEVGEPVVGHHHSLRLPCRTRRVDEVRGVVDAKRRQPIGVGDNGFGAVAGLRVEFVEVIPVDGGGQRLVVAEHGQTERRTRVLDHLHDPLERVVEVDRQIRRAGLRDRPRADDRAHRSADTECHHGLRTGTEFDEPPGEAVGELVESLVGERLATVGHRDARRVGLDPSCEEVGQSLGFDTFRAADGGQIGEFGLAQHVDVTDDHVGVDGDSFEDAHEPLGERVDRRLVEKVCRIGEDGIDRRTGLVVVTDRQLQVELGDVEVGADRRHLQTRQGEFWCLVVVERQRDLEQRMVRGGAVDVEHLDEALERDVPVGHRVDVGGSDLREQIDETHLWINLGP